MQQEVLVVDDEPLVRKLLQVMLEESYQVNICENVLEADMAQKK